MDCATRRSRATDSGEFASGRLARLALAREHGFVSWPRLKLQTEALTLEAETRAEMLVRSACSSDVRRARTLLAELGVSGS